MPFYKNVAGQVVSVYATDSTGTAKTGDAANITGYLSKDAATPVATSAVHPTEVGGGFYVFPLSQAETNANILHWYASSTTSGVTVEGGWYYTSDPISPITGSVAPTSITTFSFGANTGLQAVDQFYTGMCLVFTSGTLAGVARRITSYVGVTRTFTFARPWPATPTSGDSFTIVGLIDQP
jgi:hypothetical protein